jgi:hypothetical protein
VSNLGIMILGRPRAFLVAAAVAIAPGCVHARSSSPPIVEAPKQRTLSHERGPSIPAIHAPWLEPPLDDFREWAEWADLDETPLAAPRRRATVPDLGPVTHVVAGRDVNLLRSAFGDFVLHARDGLVGPIDLPEKTGVVFFDGDDTLYMADDEGSLHAARYASASGFGDFEPVGAVPGAVAWSAGGHVIAASTGAQVHVSVDGGRTFVATTPRPSEDVALLEVMPSGSIFVALEGTGWPDTATSNDAGVHWKPTLPLPPLQRTGGWLHGIDVSCSPPVHAVLADDERTWIEVSSERMDDATFADAATVPRALRTLAVSPTLVAYADLPEPSWSYPAAPPKWQKKYPGDPACKGTKVGAGRKTKNVKLVEVGKDIEPSPDCEGVECVRGMRSMFPLPTKTRAHLLHDGSCKSSAAVDEACGPNAKLVRRPHVLVTQVEAWNRKVPSSVHVAPLPDDCSPSFVTFAGGLLVLACDVDGGLAFHVATPDAHWHHEVDSSGARFDVDDFEMAADGSAMFAAYPADGGAGVAWVRAPVDVGVAKAWRDVTRSHAVDYALMEGGGVDVLLSDPSEGPHVFSLVHESSDGSKTTILSSAKLDGDLFCFGHADGRVVGIRRTAKGGYEAIVMDTAGIHGVGTLLDAKGRTDLSGRCGF